MGCIYARCEVLGIYVHEFKEYKTKVCHSTCTNLPITPQQHVDKLSINYWSSRLHTLMIRK